MDLYNILGVHKKAPPELIKKAHRRLVKKYHPDIGGDPETFSRVQKAYEILSDSALRKEYDETGKIPKQNPDNISPQSYNLFFQLFVAVVQQVVSQGRDPESADLVALINKRAVGMLEKDVCEGIKNLKSTNTILEKMITRFKNKDKTKEPFAASILRNAIQNNEKQIEGLEQQRKVIENLIVMLDDLVFDAKSSNTIINMTLSGSSTTSSGSWYRF